MREMDDNTALVEMKGIIKAFQGVRANDQIDFNVRRGEVHALLGENGAGKSTLMNVLSGIYRPDHGTIAIDGVQTHFTSPHDAIKAGIGMVHQHFMLIPSQTVWENMVLGLKDLPQILPKKQIIERIRTISDQYGLEVDPMARIWQLSIGEQQRVAILKTLYREAEVLVLDEPTAVITPIEIKNLFATIKRMTGEGRGVIFISHKLDEVMELSDRITILRKGKLIGTVNTRESSKEKIADMMVGKKVNLNIEKKSLKAGKTVLSAKNLKVLGDRGLNTVKDVSLELRKNEILGLAGIAGNGQTELCQALVGLRRLVSGHISLDGENFSNASPRKFIASGVSYIPADRKGTGLVANMDINENSALKRYWQKPVAKGLLIDWRAVFRHALEIVNNFNVDTPSMTTPVRNLSGGNLQKLMLGRELTDRPKILIAMHPTWGLDVAATTFVRQQILAERERGSAVLLVSEDLDELFALSDRLAVMYGGELMGTIEDPQNLNLEHLGLMMAGTPMNSIGGVSA